VNALQKIVFQAGQKKHESLYDSTLTFPAFGDAGVTVPCAHTEITKDFDLVPGGKSPKLFIENIFFRAETLPAGKVPDKGLFCNLDLGNGDAPIALQLWHGGLQPGGLIYKFMAVDKNYKA